MVAVAAMLSFTITANCIAVPYSFRRVFTNPSSAIDIEKSSSLSTKVRPKLVDFCD
ncbi:hypothetical protein DSM107010_51310 [Chroococcidiopsis cubana SAG 39.79]|uniref:Uncharacterized protein n=1 Tax=Chroococcidiopsis cubana SAG 39.79 TaxID=388085 RepID=A0AB37UDE6_9CYAN|nr:hypothetical protein DSM107010_51310 [Chroococcidiopsis cubana SAG 39.79]